MLLPNRQFTLGLSLSVKSHKAPKAKSIRLRGVRPQTSYSKKVVKSAVFHLEQKHGKHNLAFATYTLPEFDETVIFYLLQNWGEVTRQFKQKFERELKKAGLKPEIVYITEIQIERFMRTGIPVPHIHAVFQSRKNKHSEYAISKERNTELWNEVISNVLKEPVGVEMPYAANIQTVKFSAEGYTCKYMSKGSDIVNLIENEELKAILPKSWWGMSSSLRKWVKANTKVFTDATKEYIRNNYKRWLKDVDNSPFEYLHLIEIENTHGEMIPVCLVGKIRKYSLHLFPAVFLRDKPMPWAV